VPKDPAVKKLGVWLRQTREAKGNTLEEAEASTRILARFLEILEAGNFAALPGGEVQARGFLRIYARYLDLPPDEVLARYIAEVHKAEDSEAVSAQALPLDHSSSNSTSFQQDFATYASSRWISMETILVVGAVLIVLLAIVAAVSYFMSRNLNARSVAAITATAPSETAPPSTATPTLHTPTPTFPTNPAGNVTLTLKATEHVWVRVKRDARTVFEQMMAPEQTETWTGREEIVVETGNGAGLQVAVNRQPQGTLCERGQVCSRAWGPSGEITTPGP
jgi:cytoskeleton protein RodZ